MDDALNVEKDEEKFIGIGLTVLVHELDRANIAYWNWDLLSDEIYLSASYRRLLGIGKEAPLSYDRFLAAVHPQDRQYVHDAVQACLLSKSDQEYEIEYRVLLTDDTIRWIHGKGSTTVAAGQPIRMAGIAFDITARRISEELASFEQARLEATLEQLPHGVMFADASSGRLVLVNDQVEHILGHHFIASEGIEQYCSYQGFHPDGRRYEVDEWPLVRPWNWRSVLILRSC